MEYLDENFTKMFTSPNSFRSVSFDQVLQTRGLSHCFTQINTECRVCFDLQNICKQVYREALGFLGEVECMPEDGYLSPAKKQLITMIESGRIDERIELVEILDHSHPVRLATPRAERAFSIRFKSEAKPVESTMVCCNLCLISS